MSANLNKVFIAGNIVRTPEVQETEDSTVAKFTLAINKTYKNKNGEKVKSTEYIPVVVWGITAVNVGKYLDKGSSVLVEGEFTTRSWEDKEGKKRYKSEIKAMNVTFLDSKRSPYQAPSTNDPEDTVPF